MEITQGQDTRGKQIKSIVKAAAIINTLADNRAPMALAALAKETGLAKTTLHGLVSTLVDVGFLFQEPQTGYYRLSTRLFEIGSGIANQWDERKIAYPYIQRIVAEVEETVHMAVLDDFEVLYINKQESGSSVRIVTDIGVKLPAHCTGVGKALLVGMSKQEIHKLVRRKGLKRYTPNTITDVDALLDELVVSRRRGYAIDEQEYIEGLRCVAVPIFNHAGQVSSSLSISGPVSRLQGEKFEQCKQSLLKTATEISSQLGYEGKRGESNEGSIASSSL